MVQQRNDKGLTARQIKILEAAQQAGLHRNIEKVCQEADVPVRTFYRWLAQDPRFKERWDRLWYDSARRHLPGAIQALAYEAHDGNVHAIKLLSELAGVYQEKKGIEVSTKDGQPLFGVVMLPPILGQEGEEGQDVRSNNGGE